MKLRPQSFANRAGSVLIITLTVGMLIGMVLASYLILIRHQNTMAARSLAWNNALAAAEAGVEESLAQLNSGTVNLTNRWDANGWQFIDDGYQPPVERRLDNGGYDVAFTAATCPTIYSTGYVRIPALNVTVKRILEVQTTNPPVFGAAVTALDSIDLQGHKLNTDSYDSTKAPYNGRRVGSNGDVVSARGIMNAGIVTLYGHLLTAPSAVNNVQTLARHGYVGHRLGSGRGIQTNYYAAEFNAELPEAGLPGLRWLPYTSRSHAHPGPHYDYVFDHSDDAVINDLDGPLLVESGANVNLWIKGNVTLGSHDSIEIQSGGKLTIYMQGATFDLGASTINVAGKDPLAFTYYGLPSNTSIRLGGAEFYGTIYAPQANLRLEGGGAFYGACLAKSVTTDGNYSFHYDEALASRRTSSEYIVTSWREE
jgi:hypothetical protein